MPRLLGAAFLFVLALAACGRGDRLATLGDGPFAPRGVIDTSRAVDGLTVGNNLMAAGEYDLALREFYRAAGDEGLTAEVLTAIGSAQLRLGRLGQAEETLRSAVEKDETNPAAWNNLGVVLMETGQAGEASRIFRTAFALDSGESVEIRENLRRSLSRLENPAYTSEKQETFELVRAGSGQWQLLTSP